MWKKIEFTTQSFVGSIAKTAGYELAKHEKQVMSPIFGRLKLTIIKINHNAFDCCFTQAKDKSRITKRLTATNIDDAKKEAEHIAMTGENWE